MGKHEITIYSVWLTLCGRRAQGAVGTHRNVAPNPTWRDGGAFLRVYSELIPKHWLEESQGKTKPNRARPKTSINVVLASLAHPSWYFERLLNELLVKSNDLFLFFPFNGVWDFWPCLFSLHSPDTLILPAIMASSTPGFPCPCWCLFLCFLFWLLFLFLPSTYGAHPGLSPWSLEFSSPSRRVH